MITCVIIMIIIIIIIMTMIVMTIIMTIIIMTIIINIVTSLLLVLSLLSLLLLVVVVVIVVVVVVVVVVFCLFLAQQPGSRNVFACLLPCLLARSLACLSLLCFFEWVVCVYSLSCIVRLLYPAVSSVVMSRRLAT